jgi:hypothetical protein
MAGAEVRVVVATVVAVPAEVHSQSESARAYTSATGREPIFDPLMGINITYITCF